MTMADPGWGIWGKCPQSCGGAILLLVKILKAKVNVTHKIIHILLAFSTNSPETKVKQGQTSYEIFTQHLRAY